MTSKVGIFKSNNEVSVLSKSLNLNNFKSKITKEIKLNSLKLWKLL